MIVQNQPAVFVLLHLRQFQRDGCAAFQAGACRQGGSRFSAEKHRCDINQELVHQPQPHKFKVERGAAFDHQPLNAQCFQGGQGAGQVNTGLLVDVNIGTLGLQDSELFLRCLMTCEYYNPRSPLL